MQNFYIGLVITKSALVFGFTIGLGIIVVAALERGPEPHWLSLAILGWAGLYLSVGFARQIVRRLLKRRERQRAG